MRVVIIEDETAAAQNLSAILHKVLPEIEIVSTIDTVVDSVEFFQSAPAIDLVFMDIHLADGASFRIFDNVELDPDNNGDGVIDAGETVALGFTVRNRWGMAENTLVTVDALSPADIPCPFVTITDYEGEQNEDGDWEFFGKVTLYGDGEWEWGYFTLAELQEIRFPPFGLPIERDIYLGKHTKVGDIAKE